MATELIELEGKYIEVYIRFNEDNEKDYCFNVESTSTFADLDKIFRTLPMSLNPTIFSKHVPKSYAVSRWPGHLTPEGGLLFHSDASKKQYLEVMDRSELVIDHVWPGQQIIPIWEWNYPVYYSTLAIFAVWFWSDLPDFITPTPWIRVSRNLMIVGAWVMDNVLNNQAVAADMLKEAYSESGMIAQWIFFALHCVKFLFIWLILYVGAFNPYTFNPYKQNKKLDMTREQLLEIGWTSSRRATIEEFASFYREQQIKQAGGIIQASKTGVLESLRDNGCRLGEGEGFDTEIPKKGEQPITVEVMRKLNRFKLNYDYTQKIGQFFEDSLEDKSKEEQATAIKNFRKYGPLACPQSIKEIYLERKTRGHGTIAEE